MICFMLIFRSSQNRFQFCFFRSILRRVAFEATLFTGKCFKLSSMIRATSCENVSSRIFEQVRFKQACSATEAS